MTVFAYDSAFNGIDDDRHLRIDAVQCQFVATGLCNTRRLRPASLDVAEQFSRSECRQFDLTITLTYRELCCLVRHAVACRRIARHCLKIRDTLLFLDVFAVDESTVQAVTSVDEQLLDYWIELLERVGVAALVSVQQKVNRLEAYRHLHVGPTAALT